MTNAFAPSSPRYAVDTYLLIILTQKRHFSDTNQEKINLVWGLSLSQQHLLTRSRNRCFPPCFSKNVNGHLCVEFINIHVDLNFLCTCRSTCASWSTRWSTLMSARRTLWPCTMAAVPSKTSRPSSAAPLPMMWCWITVWESCECGPMRRADSAGSACSSPHLLTVSVCFLDNTTQPGLYFSILFHHFCSTVSCIHFQ